MALFDLGQSDQPGFFIFNIFQVKQINLFKECVRYMCLSRDKVDVSVVQTLQTDKISKVFNCVFESQSVCTFEMFFSTLCFEPNLSESSVALVCITVCLFDLTRARDTCSRNHSFSSLFQLGSTAADKWALNVNLNLTMYIQLYETQIQGCGV